MFNMSKCWGILLAFIFGTNWNFLSCRFVILNSWILSWWWLSTQYRRSTKLSSCTKVNNHQIVFIFIANPMEKKYCIQLLELDGNLGVRQCYLDISPKKCPHGGARGEATGSTTLQVALIFFLALCHSSVLTNQTGSMHNWHMKSTHCLCMQVRTNRVIVFVKAVFFQCHFPPKEGEM